MFIHNGVQCNGVTHVHGFLIVLGQQWEMNDLYQALHTQEILAPHFWFWSSNGIFFFLQ